MKRDFQVGDLATTQGSQFAPNNGRTVVILLIDPGREAPYLIRDIAGQQWITRRSWHSGKLLPHESLSIWAARRYLRPLPPLDQESWSDWEAIGQLRLQRQLEEALGLTAATGKKIEK